MAHATRCAVSCLAASALLAACSTPPKQHPSPSALAPVKGGGYYLDDGPADHIPVNLDQIADAVPRVEPYASGPNKPYSVFGRDYVPDTSDRPSVERGIGSWYGRKFNGQKTSSGETYDMFAMTAASPTLPIPSYARVTNPATGRSVIVRINDRGPFHPGRIIDLSYAAAYKLGYIGSGSAPVQVERILPADIRAGRIPNALPPPEPAPLYASRSAPEPAISSAVVPPMVTAHAPNLAPGSAAQPLAEVAPAAPETLAGRYSALPADLMPTEVELTPPPGVSVMQSDNAAVVANAMGEGVFLQLAAFRVRSGADDFMAHMRSELDASLSMRLRVLPGTDFYRVQIGPYDTRLEAMNAAQHLREDLGIEPMLITPR